MALLDYFKKCTKNVGTPQEIYETLTTETTNEVVDTVSIPTSEADLQNCTNVRRYYSAVGVPYLYGEGDEKIDPIEMFKDLIDEWDNDGLFQGDNPVSLYFGTYDVNQCNGELVEHPLYPEYYVGEGGSLSQVGDVGDNFSNMGYNPFDICDDTTSFPLSSFLDTYYSGTPESDFNYANLIYQKFYDTNGIRPYEDLQPYYENALNSEYALVSTNEGCFDNITEEDFIQLETPNFTPYLHDFQGWGRTSNVNANGETCEWDWKKIALAGAGVYLIFKIL